MSDNKQFFRRRGAFTKILAAGLAGLVAGWAFSHAPAQAQEDDGQLLPRKMLREFSEVYELVRSHYVEDVDEEWLMESAIRGMLSGLDPHSVYLTAAEQTAFRESITGEFGGIGIFIGQKDGLVHVISPIDDTPAQRAGIKSGDLISKLDGVSTRGMDLSQAVDTMRGKPGDEITLEVIRRGEQKPLEFVLSREVIKTPSVRSALAGDGLGYVRITQFQPRHTQADLVKHLNRLYDENGGPLAGVILDLRNNPGGDLEASIGVSSVFLQAGVPVVSDRRRDQKLDERLSGPDTYPFGDLKDPKLVKSMPLVVLVNGGSASASEIVAGALQDHNRAVVIGTQTYGKASVQNLFTLRSQGNTTALKLTTARYFTPSGQSIQARGILPDVEVQRAVVEQQPEFFLREAELPGHLDGDGETSAEAADTPEDEAAESLSALPKDDYQFEQAVNILRALAKNANAG